MHPRVKHATGCRTADTAKHDKCLYQHAIAGLSCEQAHLYKLHARNTPTQGVTTPAAICTFMRTTATCAAAGVMPPGQAHVHGAARLAAPFSTAIAADFGGGTSCCPSHSQVQPAALKKCWVQLTVLLYARSSCSSHHHSPVCASEYGSLLPLCSSSCWHCSPSWPGMLCSIADGEKLNCGARLQLLAGASASSWQAERDVPCTTTSNRSYGKLSCKSKTLSGVAASVHTYVFATTGWFDTVRFESG